MRNTLALSFVLTSALVFSGCHFHKKSAPIRTVTPLHQAALPKSTPPVEGTPIETNSIVIPALTDPVEEPHTNIQPQPPALVEIPKTNEAPKESRNEKLIVTPDFSYSGNVTLVNNGAKFIVVTFPIGHLPAENQLMSLYRRGLKVGEIKMTGPQKDDNVVADVLNGDAQLGDEAR